MAFDPMGGPGGEVRTGGVVSRVSAWRMAPADGAASEPTVWGSFVGRLRVGFRGRVPAGDAVADFPFGGGPFGLSGIPGVVDPPGVFTARG